jgi:hypothetical protein
VVLGAGSFESLCAAWLHQQQDVSIEAGKAPLL